MSNERDIIVWNVKFCRSYPEITEQLFGWLYQWFIGFIVTLSIYCPLGGAYLPLVTPGGELNRERAL